MSQSVASSQWAPEERALAQRLWDSLVFPPSPAELKRARQQMLEAPAHIQQALINEIAGAIRQHREPQRGENPFVLRTQAS